MIMNKYILQTLLGLMIAGVCFGQGGTNIKPQPFNTLFNAEKKWLVLPVKNGAPKRRIDIWYNGQLVRYLDIELAEDSADWFSYLDISEWKGRILDLRVNLMRPGSKTFSPVKQSDLDINAGIVYQEKYRGQFHFSPKRGWLNDPNGLVYYKGEYHLFFQHNPYGTEWGNMHWGHAVSKDLVHWTELGEAIYPGECGTIFSGTAVVDSNNTSGFGNNGQAPLLTFFTCDGSWTQGLTYSTDGRRFEKLSNTVVPRYSMGNRDPKVLWHESSKQWVMVFWAESVTEPRKHTLRFYTSPNLKDWTYTSSLEGGAGNDNYLFECPELYELPVQDESSTKKWVIAGANGMYAIGSFDGKLFKVETDRLQGIHGRDFYAAQTFNNEPNQRIIEMGWWRTKTNVAGMPFNQSQSIPIEIKLVKTDAGLRIARFPVKELESLRQKKHAMGRLALSAQHPVDLSRLNLHEFEMRLQLEPGTAKQIQWNIHGKQITYNVQQQQLSCDGVTAPAPLVKGKLELVVYADRIGFEIFTADGLLFMPVNVNLDTTDGHFSIAVTGGKARISSMVIFELGGVWK